MRGFGVSSHVQNEVPSARKLGRARTPQTSLRGPGDLDLGIGDLEPKPGRATLFYLSLIAKVEASGERCRNENAMSADGCGGFVSLVLVFVSQMDRGWESGISSVLHGRA